jgi:hypothetical protein
MSFLNARTNITPTALASDPNVTTARHNIQGEYPRQGRDPSQRLIQHGRSKGRSLSIPPPFSPLSVLRPCP